MVQERKNEGERKKEWVLVPGVRAARAAHGSTGACAAHACVTPIGETSAREARGEVALNEEGNCFHGVEKRTKDGERRALKVSEGTGIFFLEKGTRRNHTAVAREARRTAMEDGPARASERETCRFDETVGIEG